MRQKPQEMHCHVMIRDTAREMAGALYEACASGNNDWYKANPDQAAFIARTWPRLVAQARATLAGLLARPIDEALKEQIHDALIKDATLMRGRVRTNGVRR